MTSELAMTQIVTSFVSESKGAIFSISKSECGALWCGGEGVARATRGAQTRTGVRCDVTISISQPRGGG